jgi:hypothetical protein
VSALVDAWQAALSAEEQAVYGYGLLGPYVSGAAHVALAHTCLAAHEGLRDDIVSAMTTAEQNPADPPADYPLLYPVSVGPAAAQLAVRLEQDAATAWRYLYVAASKSRGATATMLRTAAQAALIASAVRAVQWRQTVAPTAATVPFPGI